MTLPSNAKLVVTALCHEYGLNCDKFEEVKHRSFCKHMGWELVEDEESPVCKHPDTETKLNEMRGLK